MFRLTLLAICAMCALASKTRYDDFQVFEVKAKSDSDVMLIKSLEDSDALELDFWQDIGRDVPAHICVSPQHRQELMETLTNLGLEYKVVVADVQQQIDEVDEQTAKIPLSQRNIQNTYYTYAQNIAYLEAIQQQHPDLMSIADYGTSRNGRRLFYVKLSGERFSNPDPAESKKPVIWIEATTHAREWITNACALNFIEWLVTSYGHDSSALEMMDKYDWFIVPMMNPDGYDYTQTTRLWRKTRTSGSCFDSGTGNGNGVDPNRNWGHAWGGGTTSQCSSTYQGPSAFSEPANSFMADAMTKTPAQYRKGFFSLHSYSQFIMTPYGYSTSAHVPNYSEQLRVANAARQAIIDNGGPAFRVGKPGEILYNAPGIASDWAYGGLGFTYSFTYELHPASSNPGFVLPPSLIYSSFLDFLASIIAIADEMN